MIEVNESHHQLSFAKMHFYIISEQLKELNSEKDEPMKDTFLVNKYLITIKQITSKVN